MSLIQDKGFIIFSKKYSEKSLMLKIFSESNGIIFGFLKNNHKKEEKYNKQVGNLINFTYVLKNTDKKEIIETDVITNFLNIIFYNRLYLNIFNSLISILDNSINENDNSIDEIYKIFEKITLSFVNNDRDILLYYINFLFKIIAYLGININTTKCAVSGKKNVFYISPKTGNCVTKVVGEKYKDKLFIIPKCFYEHCLEKQEIINSINILHYFIHKTFKENNILFKYRNINLFRKNITNLL